MPEVSKLIDSVMNKRQGDQRKHIFLEKKNTPQKGKWIHYEHPEIKHQFMYRAMKQSIHQFHKKFILIHSYLKTLSRQCRKNIRVEDNSKRISIASYINIYTFGICDENDSRLKRFNQLNTSVWMCF